jgi:uncharacterized membrane protein YccC
MWIETRMKRLPFLRLPSSKARDYLFFGLKVALAVSLSHLALYASGLGNGVMAALSALVVMQMRVADTVELSGSRLLGALIGAVAGTAGILLAPNSPTGNLAALFISTLLCTFITRWNPRFRMSAVAAAAVILAGAGHDANRLLIASHQLLEICSGVLIALAVSLCFRPMRAAEALYASLKAQCRLAADTLDRLTAAFLDHQRHLPPAVLEPFLFAVRENHDMLAKVREHESLLYYREHAQLGHLVQGLDLVTTHLNALFDALDDVCDEGVDLIMTPEIRDLSGTVSATLRHIAEPASETPWPDLTLQERFCRTRMNELRAAGILRRLSTDKLVQVLSFYQALTHLTETVDVFADRMINAMSKTPAS